MSKTNERFYSLEAMTTMFYTGKVGDKEMRKRDFRKALQITGLSIISAIVVTAVAFLAEL